MNTTPGIAAPGAGVANTDELATTIVLEAKVKFAAKVVIALLS